MYDFQQASHIAKYVEKEVFLSAGDGRLWQFEKKAMTKHKNLAQVFASIFLVFSLLFTQVVAYALEVPVSQTEHEIDGKQTLVKVYEVPPSVDPNSLIEADFEQNGFIYHMTSIVKDAIMMEDEVEVTQEYEVTVPISSEDKAKARAFENMPPYIEYDQDGYKGKLYPVPDSLEGNMAGQTSHSERKTITKTYSFDYNDDSLVPKSSGSYSLSSISWSDGAYLDDSSIPSNYIATATYSKMSYSTTVDGWSFTLSYTGNVEYASEDIIRYTLTYIGTVPEPEPEPEPTFWEKIFGKSPENDNSPDDGCATPDDDSAVPNGSTSQKKSGGLSIAKVILGGICLLAAIAAAGFCIYLAVKFIKDNRVDIYGRDEISGEYRKMKTVWFKPNKGEISFNYEDSPSTMHYRVVLKPGLAERTKGKVITIRAGQQMFKQTVGGTAGTDYVTEVNLDPTGL